MAELDLGKIKFTWKGTYTGATSYEKDDIVGYNGSSWICVNNVTNVIPSAANNLYWEKIAQGSDLGSLANLAAGDLVQYDGNEFVRVPAGTDGQFLRATGTSAAFETPPGFSIRTYRADDSSARSFNTSWNDYSQLTLTVTPPSVNTYYLIFPRIHIHLSNLGGAVSLVVRDHPDNGDYRLYEPNSTYQYYDSSGSERTVTGDVWQYSPATTDTIRLIPSLARYSSGSLVVNESSYYHSSMTALEFTPSNEA
jgi:hypothetical protein